MEATLPKASALDEKSSKQACIGWTERVKLYDASTGGISQRKSPILMAREGKRLLRPHVA
jgi:hypothetical protein